MSAASLYLIAKLSFHPTSPRSVLNVYNYLLSQQASPLWFVNPAGVADVPKPESYYLSEVGYQSRRVELFKMETVVLRSLGFNTHVVVPHTIALTYLQTINAASSALGKRVFEHLNAALLSPQLLYVTHQPHALAVGAIYLAAREVGVKLAEVEWWEIFDVDREELGFLVVAMNSMQGFAEAEKKAWAGKTIPLVVEDVAREMKQRQAHDGD